MLRQKVRRPGPRVRRLSPLPWACSPRGRELRKKGERLRLWARPPSAAGDVITKPNIYEGLPPVAAHFDAAGLRAAILDSQRHGQHYRDFTRRAMEAGVQGYIAFLRGQRVTYWGRGGDQHTEWFPGAGPSDE